MVLIVNTYLVASDDSASEGIPILWNKGVELVRTGERVEKVAAVLTVFEVKVWGVWPHCWIHFKLVDSIQHVGHCSVPFLQ